MAARCSASIRAKPVTCSEVSLPQQGESHVQVVRFRHRVRAVSGPQSLGGGCGQVLLFPVYRELPCPGQRPGGLAVAALARQEPAFQEEGLRWFPPGRPR